MNPRKKPKFNRHAAYVKRVSKSWRRPRGRDNKMRVNQKSKGKRPSVGFGAPKNLRFLHPSGMKEFYVSSLKDLEKVEKGYAIRIAAAVGKKKKTEIVKKAKEMKLKILNE
ncbi:MAG: 50S ribosomal protein L32e [Candidatus Aenigmatarchaeota archaeon]